MPYVPIGHDYGLFAASLWNLFPHSAKDVGGGGRSTSMDVSSYAELQNNPKRRRVGAGDGQEDSAGCTSNSWRQSYDGANIAFSTENYYDTVMNERLWSQLPEDLVDRILAWLPVSSFLRLRTVCKKWSTIMYSPSFLEVCSQVPTHGPYFIKISNCEYDRLLSSYNPVLNKWHNIPVSFLPPYAGFPVASAGGLLCFINKFHGVGSLPRGEEVSRNIAFSNGDLYCLTPRWYNCALLAYNLQQEVWEKVKTGRLPGYCQFRNLVGCKGCVVIVGKSVRHHILSVCIWSLDQKTMKWKEIGRMPQSMSDHFLGRPSESFYCTAHEDLIFLTRDNCDMGLLFNLSQKSWIWVSGCPNLEGFAFEPRLDAIA